MKTIEHQLTITKEHLRRARAVRWSAQTCLVAQAIAEFAGERVRYCGHTTAATEQGRGFYISEAHELVTDFDDAMRGLGEPDASTLAKLKESLPKTITIQEVVE